MKIQPIEGGLIAALICVTAIACAAPTPHNTLTATITVVGYGCQGASDVIFAESEDVLPVCQSVDHINPQEVEF